VKGFILLNVPWGLIGLSKTRQEIQSVASSLETSSAITPLLFSYDSLDVSLNGRKDALERFVGFRTRLHEQQRVWDLPVPLRSDEQQALRHDSCREELTFRWSLGVDRPSHKEGGSGDSPEAGEPWYRFILATMARMQDFEAALHDELEPWNFVLERWIDPAKGRDPTMDIVVRHAQAHRARWADIAEHPRRILNRRRELVPLSRVQELDTQCMQWLSRQPGETLAERAGGDQRILALARYENRNTLENQVFCDLLARTVAASREYLTQNAGRVAGAISRRTARYGMVQQYQRECRRLSNVLSEQEVRRPSEMVQPNYVLLHDHRYRHVWSAWQEIIRRERVMDDLWRWQRRSWAEFCKVTLVMALLAQSNRVHLIAGSPLFFRAEHHRGEWLMHDDPIAVLAHEERGWVAEIMSGDSNDVPDRMKELGAAVWIRLSDYEGGDYKYLPVWAIHSFCKERSLSDLVESANESYHFLREKAALAGGIVCLSSLYQQHRLESRAAEHVAGFSFGPWDDELPEALGNVGAAIMAFIERKL
jgi:hypothetical protein